MKLHMDKAGRVVVPKPLRQRLGLEQQGEVEAIEQPDGILFRRVQQEPSMIKLEGLWVHQGVPEPGASWDRAIDEVREERIRDILQRR